MVELDVIETLYGARLTKAGAGPLALAVGIAVFLNAACQPARADGIDWRLSQLDVSELSSPQGGAAQLGVDSNAASNFIAAW